MFHYTFCANAYIHLELFILLYCFKLLFHNRVPFAVRQWPAIQPTGEDTPVPHFPFRSIYPFNSSLFLALFLRTALQIDLSVFCLEQQLHSFFRSEPRSPFIACNRSRVSSQSFAPKSQSSTDIALFSSFLASALSRHNNIEQCYISVSPL